MDRRRFLATGTALGAASLAGTPLDGVAPRLPPLSGRVPRLAAGQAADLVLRGAVLYDGTGAPGVLADVAVVGERVAEVGRVARGGSEELDLRGLALAPGFVDIHSHADLSLLVEPRAESRVRQGVTLEVVGQDGSSVGPWSRAEARETDASYRERYGVELGFSTPGGFLDRLERTKVAVNVATMVGHGTVRATVVGQDDRPATPAELDRMKALVAEALAAGAVGLSSGLEYTPGGFADTDELVALAGALRGTGYPYASHMRNEDDRLLAAIEETLHVGRMAGVPVQVSHLKCQGQRNYWKRGPILELLAEARRSGLDVHYDRYPYVAYSTGLSNLFPSSARSGGTAAFLRRLGDPGERPALEAYARAKVAQLGSWDAVQITSVRSGDTGFAVGRKLGELATERREDPFELAVRLIVANESSVGMIGYGMSEENTEKLLAHPLGMVCSDGGAFAPYGPLSSSSPHPRAYGSFPRVLGHYVRERRAMPLETAVHKMSGMPAAKLRLTDRGVVRAGAFADLVAFDPATVADGATFTEPHRYPVGIPHVVVNGRATIRDGEQTGALAGRPVRGGASPTR